MSTLKVEKIQHPNSASVALTLDTSGYLALQAGSASTPAIQGPSDPNTGIFFPAADTIAFAEGGTEALRIDSSGRVGIGTSSPGGLLHVGASGGGVVIDSTLYSELSPPTATNDAFIFRSTNDGTLNFSSRPAAGGRAYRFWRGSNVSMIIDDSGRVGIGTTNPSRTLHVVGRAIISSGVGTNESLSVGTSSSSAGTNFGTIDINGAQYSGLYLRANDTPQFYIFTSNALTNLGTQTNISLTFDTNATERARIDTSGRLLVGTSSSLESNSLIQTYKPSGSVYSLTRSDSLVDGESVEVKAVGGGRTASLAVYKHAGITNPAPHIYLQKEDGGPAYIWIGNDNNVRTSTNPANIGTNNGTVVGSQTSDERIKNILGPVEYGLDTINQIEPVRYALKSEPDTEKLGFIAQQIQPLVPQSVFDTKEHIEGEPEDAPTKLGMEYVALIPVLVNAIKELSAKNDVLEARLSALESA